MIQSITCADLSFVYFISFIFVILKQMLKNGELFTFYFILQKTEKCFYFYQVPHCGTVGGRHHELKAAEAPGNQLLQLLN